MTYDNANRLTQRSYSDSTPTVSFTYDQNGYTGHRTTMTDGLGSVTYAFDARDRLTQETRTLTGISGTFSTSYVYNVKGDVTQMTYPSGRVVDFAYNTSSGWSNSRLSSISDGTTTTTLMNSLSLNAAGDVVSQAINPGANAVAQTFTYSSRLQLTGIQAVKGSTVLTNFTYDYGSSSQNTGRVLTRTDSVQPEHTSNYIYDSIYRLQQAANSSANWGIAWTFDVWGNRLTQTPAGLATSKVGSPQTAYTSNRNQAHTYDDAGNTTNDTIHTYAFNAENQQTTMDGGAATYSYDGEGRRMKKVTSSETTYMFYGPGGILCEFSTSSGLSSATSAASTDKTLYRTSERTGTAVILFSLSGVVLEHNRALPYGEPWLSEIAAANDKKFTTYDRDKESGLDYAMARMYASTRGRMTSPDAGPIFARKPVTLNRYVYGMLDPINMIDPDGNITFLIESASSCSYYSGTPGNDRIYQGSIYTSCYIPDGHIPGFLPPGSLMIDDSVGGQMWDQYEENARISQFVEQTAQGNEIVTSSISFPQIQPPDANPSLPSIPPFPFAGSVLIGLWPYPGIAGIGLAFTGAYLPGQQQACLGFGMGLGTTGISGGPLVFGPIDQAEELLEGPGMSMGVQLTLGQGGQIDVSPGNGTGALAGPTLGSPGGMDVSATWSFCFGI